MPNIHVGDLEVGSECASALVILRGLIAWPRDRARQERFMASCGAVPRLEPQESGGQTSGATTIEALARLLVASDGSDGPGEPHPEMKIRALLTTGATLRACKLAADNQPYGSDGRVSLRAAFREVELTGKPEGFLHSKPREIGDAWQEYKSLAHFGAALADMIVLGRPVGSQAAAIREWLTRTLVYEGALRSIQPLHAGSRTGLVPLVEMWWIESTHLARPAKNERSSGQPWASRGRRAWR